MKQIGVPDCPSSLTELEKIQYISFYLSLLDRSGYLSEKSKALRYLLAALKSDA